MVARGFRSIITPYERPATRSTALPRPAAQTKRALQAAGLDPVIYLERWPHRYMALHVKDVKAGFVPNVAMQTAPTEVGSGVMNWRAILQAAYTAGVREYYIEQEGPFVRPPPESVKISVDYVRSAAHQLKSAS